MDTFVLDRMRRSRQEQKAELFRQSLRLEQFVLDGTLVVDVHSEGNDLVTADEVRFGPSSVLIGRR